MRALRVHRKAIQRLEAGHVWVYKEEILDDSPGGAVESVKLCDERGRTVASALLDLDSQVPLRVFSRKAEVFDADLIQARIEQALEWRSKVVPVESTGYRAVFSESDLLPGLIVDRFGEGVAIQCTMRNYVPWLESILQTLETNFAISVAAAEVAGERQLLRSGSLGPVTYQLNEIRMQADLIEGPKTGAFLDQRENYLAVSAWARRLGIGGRGLDLFTSNGGFALQLATVAGSVDAVDSSETAIAMVGRNAELNGIKNLKAIKSDVKHFLRGLIQARHRYEIVVCDPPAFAKSKRHKEEALRAYYDLNLRAIAALGRKALFVSCSCSRNISETELLEAIREAASVSKRPLTLLEKRTQGLDHKVLLNIPESSYLKCLIFSAQE